MQAKNIILIICAVVVVACVVIATTVFVTRYSVAPTAATQQAAAVAPAPAATPTPVQPAAPAPAPQASTDNDLLAQIVNVKPHMVKVRVPYTRCHEESHVISTPQESNLPGAGAVIGGVGGGILGNQVGQGRGRTVATVAGAIGGALVGNAMQQNMNKPVDQTVVENRCVNRVKTTQKQKGYEVTYLYKGVQGVRVLDTQPIGNQLPISVLQAAPALEDIN